MPYGITQCYLSLGRGEIPTLTSAKPVLHLVKCRMQGWLVTYWDGTTWTKTVTHTSTNQARCKVTSFMRRILLTTTPHCQPYSLAATTASLPTYCLVTFSISSEPMFLTHSYSVRCLRRPCLTYIADEFNHLLLQHNLLHNKCVEYINLLPTS